MTRVKLTEKQKDEKKAKELAEREESNLQGQLRDLKRDIKKWINTEITYKFNVGDKVICGSHPSSIIEEVHEDGLIYKVKNFGKHKVYGIEKYYERTYYTFWVNVRPYISSEDNSNIEIISKRDDIHMQFAMQGISSLLNICHHGGIEIREVWGEEEKLHLMDSIFKNIEIGKFAIIKTQGTDKYYELLDGKQRLLTILSFYENKFSYKGKYYNEMSWRDQNHFEHYGISVGYVEGTITQKQKYEYFLKLNTTGKPVAKTHLDKVRKLLNYE